jgi:hypothetical protein
MTHHDPSAGYPNKLLESVRSLGDVCPLPATERLKRSDSLLASYISALCHVRHALARSEQPSC